MFQNIGKYILSLQTIASEPPSKKRKIEGVQNGNSKALKKEEEEEGGDGVGGGEGDDDVTSLGKGNVVCSIKDISFSIPQRKKFSLLLTATSMSAVNATTGGVEFGVPWDDIREFLALFSLDDYVCLLNIFLD